MRKPEPPPGSEAPQSSPTPADEPFDAVSAAAELEESMARAEGTPSDGPGRSPEYVAVLEAELQELTQLLAAKDKEIQELEASRNRAQLEVTAARSRLQRDAQRDAEQRVQAVVLSFIGVLDDLDRALAAAQGSKEAASPLGEGLALVRNKFLAKLQELGVTRRESLGQHFDPAWHEALGTGAVTDPAHDGVVVHIVEDAYVLGDVLLRPARVIVGKLPQ